MKHRKFMIAYSRSPGLRVGSVRAVTRTQVSMLTVYSCQFCGLSWWLSGKGWLSGKESPASARDTCWIPGSAEQ